MLAFSISDDLKCDAEVSKPVKFQIKKQETHTEQEFGTDKFFLS